MFFGEKQFKTLADGNKKCLLGAWWSWNLLMNDWNYYFSLIFADPVNGQALNLFWDCRFIQRPLTWKHIKRSNICSRTLGWFSSAFKSKKTVICSQGEHSWSELFDWKWTKRKTTVLRSCLLKGCLFCLHELFAKSHEGCSTLGKNHPINLLTRCAQNQW